MFFLRVLMELEQKVCDLFLEENKKEIEYTRVKQKKCYEYIIVSLW